MNEHALYQNFKISWVFYLMNKYCIGERFDAMRGAFKAALTEEELEAAREMWKKEQK